MVTERLLISAGKCTVELGNMEPIMANVFYHSAEIRWFLPGLDQRDEFLKWFRLQDQLALNVEKEYDSRTETEPFVKQELERTDEYLLLPDCDTASVKQRQGRLEVKALVAGPRPFAVGAATGRLDQWVKWSFEPSDAIADQFEVEIDQSGPWRKVVKKRYLQKYSFDSGLVAVSPDQQPDTGCSIELTVTDVKANVGTWLTFGFEAFGPSGRVMALLGEAVAHFFAAHGSPPVRLEGRDSLSYPAWLAMLR
jgi:hypothetical protein